MRISTSDINGFLRCRRQWHYGSENGMNLGKNETAPALFLGEIVHAALELWYRPVNSLALPVLFKQEFDNGLARLHEDGVVYDADKYRDLFFLGMDMMHGYVAHYGADPNNDKDGMRVISTEQEFAIRIPGTDDGWYVGRWDGVVLDRDGCLWIMDHKTYSQPNRVPLMSLQFLGYAWAAQASFNATAVTFAQSAYTVRKGTHMYGTMVNGLRKQRPSDRVRLPLFTREWLARSRTELAQFELMLRQIYKEMTSPTLVIYPTMTPDCARCGFREPCLARNRGQDEAWLLNHNYQKRPPRGSVYTGGELDAAEE